MGKCLAMGSVSATLELLSHMGLHLGYLWPTAVGEWKWIKSTGSTVKKWNNWILYKVET